MKKILNIDSLPTGWISTTIDSIAYILMGQSPPSSTYNDEGKGLPFFQGKAEFTDIYPIVKKWCSEPIRIAEKEDILLSVRAPVGSVNIANQKCCIGRGLAAIRYKYNHKLLFYFFQFIKDDLEKKGTGTTFKAISGEIVKNQRFFLPPLSEQHRIVTKLDELFSELEKGKEQFELVQQKLRIFRQALLKAAFEGRLTNKEVQVGNLPQSWKWVKFIVFCKLQRGYDLPLSKIIKGKYPVVTSAGINGYHNEYKANGPCLTTGRSGGVGNINYLEVDRYWPHNTVLFVKDFCGNYPKFVFYFFKQFNFKSFSVSTAVPTLDRKQLYNEIVPQPEIEEQKLIVEILDKKFSECDKLEDTIIQKLQYINSLKQSILQKAFSGQLVPQDPNDEPASVLLERIKKEREEYLKNKEKEKKIVSRKTKISMTEELKSIMQLLQETKKPIAAKALWQASEHKENIDEFYAELKKLIEKGEIKETERKGKESYLTLANSK